MPAETERNNYVRRLRGVGIQKPLQLRVHYCVREERSRRDGGIIVQSLYVSWSMKSEVTLNINAALFSETGVVKKYQKNYDFFHSLTTEKEKKKR